MKLSILVLTLPNRERPFNRLMNNLYPQMREGIEVLVCNDNVKCLVGTKRTYIMNKAKGDYIVFVDDDDYLANNYVELIWDHLDGVNDYIGYKCRLIENGQLRKPTYHSLKYNNWFETYSGYYRDITHKNPIKRELVKNIKFPDIQWAEDKVWCDYVRNAGVIKKEHYIDEFMYFYDYRGGRNWDDIEIKEVPVFWKTYVYTNKSRRKK